MMKKLFLLLITFSTAVFAQHNNPNPGYWQQQVDYQMDVHMNVDNYNYTGTQKLTYTNNSPDTLHRVFYHLYYNAFQPGSEMDNRLTSIEDPDKRMVKTIKNEKGEEKVISAIGELKPDEIGFLKVTQLQQDNIDITPKVVGTILEVDLAKPLLPGKSTQLNMTFEGQVPVMVRRAGRNSKEGVALSMSQWYPKMAEYDFEGWHADPYIAREFHGVWGNFDVKITIDKEYTIGASGYLQNKNEIGHGYQDEGVKVKHPRKTKELTWHFIAPNVHDFAWGADPDYIHDKVMTDNGIELHFFYKDNKEIKENWKKLQPKTVDLMKYFETVVGEYPYKQYSVIQGGDGGMEYAMCTLITGERKLASLIGVTAHELAHMWFQHMLATNESKHPWMDEGFTSFISDLAVNQIMEKHEQEDENPFQTMYGNYYYLVQTGKEEPLTTHADRYASNLSYGIASYTKGAIFITQLAYIIGWDNTMNTLQQFYTDYRFSHPTPNDFKRTAEKVSGAQLDWYLIDWTQTTKTVDYGIKTVDGNEITLERIGEMPMPIDLVVVYEDETTESYYIPNDLLRWTKPNPYPNVNRTVLSPWGWATTTYTVNAKAGKKIKAVAIDPSSLMTDVDLSNNTYVNE